MKYEEIKELFNKYKLKEHYASIEIIPEEGKYPIWLHIISEPEDESLFVQLNFLSKYYKPITSPSSSTLICIEQDNSIHNYSRNKKNSIVCEKQVLKNAVDKINDYLKIKFE